MLDASRFIRMMSGDHGHLGEEVRLAEEPAAATRLDVGVPPRGEEITLSAERWVVLAPKLQALLADFRKLEAIDPLDGEPVTQLQRWERDDHASR